MHSYIVVVHYYIVVHAYIVVVNSMVIRDSKRRVNGCLCVIVCIKCVAGALFNPLLSSVLLHSATFDRIAEINFNLDADDNSVSV